MILSGLGSIYREVQCNWVGLVVFYVMGSLCLSKKRSSSLKMACLDLDQYQKRNRFLVQVLFLTFDIAHNFFRLDPDPFQTTGRVRNPSKLRVGSGSLQIY